MLNKWLKAAHFRIKMNSSSEQAVRAALFYLENHYGNIHDAGYKVNFEKKFYVPVEKNSDINNIQKANY